MGRLAGFWVGIVAGLGAVFASLLGRILFSVPTLPELVQDRLVLLTPGPYFAFALSHLLSRGKPLLFALLLLGQMLCGGFGGILISRRYYPYAAAAAAWLIIGCVLLPLAGRGFFAGSVGVAAVTAVAGVLYAQVYSSIAGVSGASVAWLSGTSRKRAPITPVTRARTLHRRTLLGAGVFGLGTVVLAKRVIGPLPLSGSASLAHTGHVGPPETLLSPAAQVIASIPDLPLPVTPAAHFYLVSKNLVDPDLDAARWHLKIEGLVNRPLRLSYADLLAMPAVEEYRTLECISNEVGGGLISTALWTGVRFAELLTRAGLRDGASALNFVSSDGYTASMPLAQAWDPATLLAYRLNHSPLTPAHGYPVRVLGATTYGMKNPKWLTTIEVAKAARTGYWQEQGWDNQGVVQTMAQIDTPWEGARLPVDTTEIGGIAFAGGRDITRVEVTTGGGHWDDAALLPSLGANTWRFWQFAWRPAGAGDYAISVRATDGSGSVQTMRRADPFPAGATGYHEIHIRVTS